MNMIPQIKEGWSEKGGESGEEEEMQQKSSCGVDVERLRKGGN
jgi:hypothetical protein